MRRKNELMSYPVVNSRLMSVDVSRNELNSDSKNAIKAAAADKAQFDDIVVSNSEKLRTKIFLWTEQLRKAARKRNGRSNLLGGATPPPAALDRFPARVFVFGLTDVFVLDRPSFMYRLTMTNSTLPHCSVEF